jgi:RNA polymerase sigma-70 factor (ECF subfamily)
MGTNHSQTPPDNPHRDAILIGRLKTDPKDNEAWAVLVRENSIPLLAAIRRWVWNQDDADEFLQETWQLIALKIAKFDTNRPFLPFAVALAHNLVQSAVRRKKPPIVNCPPSPTDAGEANLLKHGPALDQSPGANLEAAEEHRMLHEALEQLPQDNRNLFMLKYFEDMTHDQIATHLNVAKGTVASRCNRALKKLREILARLDPAPE